MNKKNNRKGFTTVELVIVIAVIAILATVLIPTFSNLINKANASGALQTARSALNTVLAETTDPTSKVFTGTAQVIVYSDKNGTHFYELKDNVLTEVEPTVNDNGVITNVKFYVGATQVNFGVTITNNVITEYTATGYTVVLKTNDVAALKDLPDSITVLDIKKD